jgi:hypothetical protein
MKERQKTCRQKYLTCGLFFQLLRLSFFIVFIIAYIKKENSLSIIFGISFLILYIINVIVFSCSNYSQFLKNKRSINSIEFLMKKIFSEPPKLTFFSESYHYRQRDDERRTEETVYTHKTSYDFYYKSFKDISESFKIDENINKSYLKLFLSLKIDFDNEITFEDYEIKRKSIIERDKKRDTYHNFWLEETVDGFKNYLLIDLGKGKSCVNVYDQCYSMILTLLIPIISEFYVLYNEFHSVEYSFTVNKVISTRNNLNEDENIIREEPQSQILNQNQVENVVNLDVADIQPQILNQNQDENVVNLDVAKLQSQILNQNQDENVVNSDEPQAQILNQNQDENVVDLNVAEPPVNNI